MNRWTRCLPYIGCGWQTNDRWFFPSHEMVLRIESGCSGSRNFWYAAIRTVRDARQGGAYLNGWRELALYLSKMVVGGKLLALLLPFSLLLSLAYSATVTSTAATCFATLFSATVGSTTFAATGFGTRPYAAAGGGSGGEAGSRSTFPESTGSTARSTASSTDSTMSFFIDCFINRIAGINRLYWSNYSLWIRNWKIWI